MITVLLIYSSTNRICDETTLERVAKLLLKSLLWFSDDDNNNNSNINNPVIIKSTHPMCDH